MKGMNGGLARVVDGEGEQVRLTAGHFLEVLGTGSLHFPEYVVNSIVVSGLSAILAVALAAPAAYAVTRLELPGRMSFLFLVLAVSMFPPVSLVSYLFRMMSALGWINTYAALVLPYTAWVLPCPCGSSRATSPGSPGTSTARRSSTAVAGLPRCGR